MGRGSKRDSDGFRTHTAVAEFWATAAAFGTYFSMYGFRKPFVAAAYPQVVFGWHEKTLLVTAQVLGYMCAKFYGVRRIAQMRDAERVPGIVLCLAMAELAWIAFGILPAPWHVLAVFANGFPLGLVFGMVLRFLEGRRHSEAMVAGLCASFIVADGVTKSVGTWLLEWGANPRWMPALAGLLFVPPLALCAALLRQVPPPGSMDVRQRSERIPMDRRRRIEFLIHHAPMVTMLVTVHVVVTVLRSLRADFAPEIWQGLGATLYATLFTRTETLIAFLVLVLHGLGVFVHDNRRALQVTLLVCLAACLLVTGSATAFWAEKTTALGVMVAIGFGLYVPYVAMHTSLFERLIAWTGDRANVAFLLYCADAIGYLGYVAVVLLRETIFSSAPSPQTTAQFFLVGSAAGGVVLAGLFATALVYVTVNPRSRWPGRAAIASGGPYSEEEQT
ncbi:MAG: hypothetical protein KatS3mg110_4354 [Pirellulaceae bacterium]|nr:MAG: hypothetical protein KatS3mg110_4354 [Pirellulaceae bacterium]